MKIPRFIALPLTGILTYTSCATAPVGYKPVEHEPYIIKCPSTSEAAKVLGTDVKNIETLPGCYKSTTGTASLLKTLAGIRLGRVRVKKNGNSYFLITEDNPSDDKADAELVKLMKEVDNGDRIITPQEAKRLKEEIIGKYSK